MDESVPLRIRDDPERGPIVEGITEFGVTSLQHLESIVSTIETRRRAKIALLWLSMNRDALGSRDAT